MNTDLFVIHLIIQKYVNEVLAYESLLLIWVSLKQIFLNPKKRFRLWDCEHLDEKKKNSRMTFDNNRWKIFVGGVIQNRCWKLGQQSGFMKFYFKQVTQAAPENQTRYTLDKLFQQIKDK